MGFRFRPPAPAGPEAPFRLPEARHGRGGLAYHQGVPVLRVGGTPEEVGEQLGVLSVRPAPRLLNFPEDLLHRTFKSRLVARLLARRATTLGRRLLPRFPEAARRELDGLVAAGLPRDRMVLGNTLYDLKNISALQVLGCSSLVVPPARSATGAPLFGRNVDFYDPGYLWAYSLVTIRPRTARAHAFASVGFPGLLGCFSGMNEAGLALASHEVFGVPGPRRYNPRGVPFTLAYRRVLEECSRAADAADLLRGIERTTSTLLVLCDRDGGRVLEVTPDHVIEYPSDGDAVTCTNHYRSPQLAGRRPPTDFRTQERLATLTELAGGGGGFGLPDLSAALHAVHQGRLTVQSMIFEPAAGVIHVGFGRPPTTARPLVRLDLNQFWEAPGAR